MKKFENSYQMNAFLKKAAKNLNFNFNNVYLTFVSRSFLERISSLEDDSIIVKGSSAEMAYLGRSVRSITDIDVATIGSFDVNFSKFNDLMGESKSDNFNFKFRKDGKKTKTGIHKMFLEADLTLLEAVFYTRAVLREMLQKNGIEMDDNIPREYVVN